MAKPKKALKHRWEYGLCIKCQKPQTLKNESLPCTVAN